MASVPCTRRKRKSRKVFRRGRCRPSMAGSESLFGSDNLPNIARVEPTAAFAEARTVCLARANPPDGGFYRRLPIARCVSVCRKIRPPETLRPFLRRPQWVRLRSRQTSKSKMRWQRRSKDGPAVPIHAGITTISNSTRHRTNDFWACWSGRECTDQQIQIHPLPAFRVRAPGRKDRSCNAGFLRPAGRPAFPNP